MGSEVVKTDKADLVEISPEEQALVAQAQGNFDQSDLVIPMLKLTQPLTNEVVDGDAKPGHYLNSVTLDDHGDEIRFVIAGQSKGRFQADKDGNVIEASHDSSGVSAKGVPYSEDPDAEEQFKAAVNRGDKEWESGPPIATTYNFVGFVVDEDGNPTIPVRISLMRTAAPAAKKWVTLNRLARAPWDTVYRLTVKQDSNNAGQKYFVPVVKQDGPTTVEQRQAAVQLAQTLQAGTVDYAEANPDGDLSKAEDVSQAEPGIAV